MTTSWSGRWAAGGRYTGNLLVLAEEPACWSIHFVSVKEMLASAPNTGGSTEGVKVTAGIQPLARRRCPLGQGTPRRTTSTNAQSGCGCTVSGSTSAGRRNPVKLQKLNERLPGWWKFGATRAREGAEQSMTDVVF